MSSANNKNKLSKKYAPHIVAASSMLASITTMSLSHPFEVLKIGQQLTFGNTTFNPRHKIKYYFKGLSSLNLAIVGKTFIRFRAYDYFCNLYENPQTGEISKFDMFKVGAFLGFIESVWVIPFENLKSRLVGNGLTTSEKLQGRTNIGPLPSKLNRNPVYDIYSNRFSIYYRNEYRVKPSMTFPQAVKEIWQVDGVKGYFRGSLATMYKNMASAFIYFSFYSSMKNAFNKENDRSKSILIGVASCSLVVIFTQPVDLIKTRLQSNRYGPRYYTGNLDCFRHTITEEGVSAFFKGWFPRLLKVGIINSGVGLGLYQYYEKILTLDDSVFQ
ncbi:uncharacterized protein SCODWIG_01759 [Saccharomycodes ludwigii]|uniref:Uncharacterized protein n=1 Tax=Saccharomycodes ludwigii TaxID=36035 RepID=A0A376B5M7_9ASCO|nr:hypothetical protein SCDLUD_002273 [Saccharomycodes ludwigii]KAH3900820.1 hypothetical protein SCDLUD_002273 [Saccharomycodes ludwigii]SSD59998.1 uncharacterized protein SCODWIG_01759 [Saccharomycodes ludwigii]